ncbi:alanine racemase [Candidatus Dependentiae bacterium Noda2021]|nr:alanine racemase [Candidatus Dependentiae bacterium Noda2021]
MYNRSYITIDSHALAHNILQYKKACGEKMLGIVVKSNAYGHGIEHVANVLQQNNHVDWLFVASLSEALLLRNKGVTKPILVMYHIDDDPSLLALYEIDVMVTDPATIAQLNELGIQHNKRIAVHIKVDTGLNRFGFLPHEVVDIAQHIQTLPGIMLKGIYSHFAEAAAQDTQYTFKQISQFNELLCLLKKQGVHIPTIHIANGAATTAFEIPQANLVRVGLGVYGHWPSLANQHMTQERFNNFELKPVLTWRSRIDFIRHIKKGDCVGYDRTFTAPRDSIIAVVPVGYFDGYDRRLSNKAHVLVNGSLAPVVGRIAMTTMMIDVTGIDAVIGTEVELIGSHHAILPTTLSALMQSYNPRELLTRIHEKVYRVIR